ncbi:MAG: recombinase family protein [Candidatus Omnitrophica bacterium]|nr:recombinase family protein [Candidatus Omnitrophota bacterium]
MVKRCGLYIRVSTDLQAKEIEGSLKTQRQRLEEDLRRRSNGKCQWIGAKIYEERGRSGKNTNRPEFQQLLHEIKEGLIDVVACTELSRISRSLSDFLRFTQFLHEQRCDLLCLKQNFDTTTPHGKLLMVITAALAEFERELVSERTKAAVFARARRGLWNGGVILGYDVDPTRKGYLIINPKEADLVRLIFKTYLQYGSFGKACRILNERGYRTKAYTGRRGNVHPAGPFQKTDVAHILQNLHYIGKKEVNKFRKRKNQEMLKPEERYQIVDGVHGPIVDIAVFNRVQELIKQNARTHHSFAQSTQHTYLLGNERVRCGVCGSVMTSAWSKGRRRIYPYYSCTRVDKLGTQACSVRRVQASGLERLILERIRKITQSPRLCNDLVGSTNRLFVKELGPLRQRKVQFERELSQVDANAKEAVTRFLGNGAEGLYYVQETLKEFEERRRQLKAEIIALESEIRRYENRQIKPEVVQQGLAVLDQVLDELTPVERKRAFELTVKEVLYTPNQITLTLYELPFIKPEEVKACRFVERTEWLPR